MNNSCSPHKCQKCSEGVRRSTQASLEVCTGPLADGDAVKLRLQREFAAAEKSIAGVIQTRDALKIQYEGIAAWLRKPAMRREQLHARDNLFRGFALFALLMKLPPPRKKRNMAVDRNKGCSLKKSTNKWGAVESFLSCRVALLRDIKRRSTCWVWDIAGVLSKQASQNSGFECVIPGGWGVQGPSRVYPEKGSYGL